MKRPSTMAKELLDLAANMEDLAKEYEILKAKGPDEKLSNLLLERNEFIAKLLLLDMETRFKYSEHPSKAQAKWFKENWGVSENTLDFFRKRKSLSIEKQYNSINTDSEKDNEDISVDNLIEKAAENTIPAVYDAKSVVNKRKMCSVWDKVTDESNLSLLEVEYHTPYKYGDIVGEDKVFVYKNKFTDKKTFFKSYRKSREFLLRKETMGISVKEISKVLGISLSQANNIIYYPYIKSDSMMVERFEKKFNEI